MNEERECEYCGSVAVCVITKIMQPSSPYYACKECAMGKHGYMIVTKLEDKK